VLKINETRNREKTNEKTMLKNDIRLIRGLDDIKILSSTIKTKLRTKRETRMKIKARRVDTGMILSSKKSGAMCWICTDDQMSD